MGYRLGVDLGTTFTAAAVDDGTGATMLGLGNRALTVPSVVFLSADGTFLFGEAAERRAAAEPTRSAREFKRRIGDTVPILLAGQPFSPQALSAKLLAWTTSIATQRQGAAPDEVVVTYPANWGGYKRELLQQIVSLADLPSAVTCTEPEAAATQYASRARLSAGDKVAVYDLGGGTFDVCVLEKDEEGFSILGSPDGVEHLGGIDFDEAVFQHVVGQLGDQLAGLDPGDPQVTDGLARLRRECVDAKEALSSDVEATVAVALPGLTTSLRLTRAELDGLITSPLRDTLDAMQRALRSAGLTAADLATVVLVGGSSRIPLVSHLLQSEYGVRTAMDTHPKHDVALGAVRYHRSGTGGVVPAAAASVAHWPTRSVTPEAPVEDPTPGDGEMSAPPEDPDVSAAPEVEVPEPVTEVLPVPPEAKVEEKHTGPPVWTPPSEAATAGVPSSSSAGETPGRRLRDNRPALVGLAFAAAVVIAGGTTYALSRGGGDGTSGPESPGTSTTTGTGAPVVGRDVILLPIVKQGSPDPVLYQISTAPDSFGDNLGKVRGIPAGSQSLPSTRPDGGVLVYRWAGPGSGFPKDNGRLMEIAHEGPPVPLFTKLPSALLCHGRAAWSPDGSRMALACNPDLDGDHHDDPGAHPEIYVGDADAQGRVDGTRLTQWATSSSSIITSLSFTQSGDIAASYKGGEEPGVYVGAVDGSPVRVTDHADTDAVASPAGDLIAFVRDGDLFVASTDQTTQPPCPSPRLSSTDATGVRLCDLTGTSTGPGAVVTDPAWSWDGRTIAYAVGSPGASAIDLISLTGGRSHRLSPPQAIGASGWGPR